MFTLPDPLFLGFYISKCIGKSHFISSFSRPSEPEKVSGTIFESFSTFQGIEKLGSKWLCFLEALNYRSSLKEPGFWPH